MQFIKKSGIPIEQGATHHRIIGRLPTAVRDYGFAIISCQHLVTEPDSFEAGLPFRTFDFFSISHMYDGAGKVELERNGTFLLSPGSVVIVAPGDRNRYGGTAGQPYCEDAISFCGPLAEALRRNGILESCVCHPGSERLLLPVMELARDPAPDSQLKANLALQEVLLQLYELRRTAPGGRMEQVIRTICRNPQKWYQVSELAAMCDMSVSRFRRAFVARTGIMPKNYIEEVKLRRAAERLAASPLPVSEVAAEFGYADPYHFSRRFKQVIGAPPRAYRAAVQRSVPAVSAGNVGNNGGCTPQRSDLIFKEHICTDKSDL